MQGIGWEYEALFDVEKRTELEMRLWENLPTEIRVGKMGYRTRTTLAGEQLTVEVYPIFGREQEGRARTALKQRTPESMARVNLRNARRRIVDLANANFTKEDLHVTMTYAQAPDYERAQKDMVNFIARVKRLRTRRGLPELKYIYAIEDNEDGEKKRIHVHMLLSGGISREEIERCWKKGLINADRLKPDENGLEAIARYLTKAQKNRKKWVSSKNLKKPRVRVSDTKLSNSKVRRMAVGLENEAKEVLRKAYPGWEYVACRVSFSDVVDGCYIRAKLHRIKEGKHGGYTGEDQTRGGVAPAQRQLHQGEGIRGCGGADAQGHGKPGE